MEQVQRVISRAGERQVLMGEENMGIWEESEIKSECKLERNEVAIEFCAQSRNESFARMVAAAYTAQLNPTMEEISDIKTAVSEAVTNAVIHGYSGGDGIIRMRLALSGDEVQIEVTDHGVGIENILIAMEPMYTTRPDMERSGMGFAFMEAFMDELEVRSALGRGTIVRMKKKIVPGVLRE